ncbi:MAG: hypothetical protein FJ276_12925 [Planctomycetes bacterium]|nr:hypothetical protein [Planctomycetota bacterium]
MSYEKGCDNMRLVKIFKSVENELSTMEQEINTWAKGTGSTIISVTGNIAPQTRSTASQGFSASDVLLVVLYEPVE